MTKHPIGLFVNTAEAQCSIYASGKMVLQSIENTAEFDLDYVELSGIDCAFFNETGQLCGVNRQPLQPASEKNQYDFILFNYHHDAMAPHLRADKIKALASKTFAIVLETDPADPFSYVPADCFSGLIVLDPTITRMGNAWPFPRPLPGAPRTPEPTNNRVITIGSFGFGTPGKGFEYLVSAVNAEFNEALVRINIPASTYADDVMKKVHGRHYGQYLADICAKAARPGIKIDVTYDFLSDSQLIDWCGANDINCFMYTRRRSGLSATTDQAVISGRPLLVSANDTFRHIHPYISPYPHNTIRDAMRISTQGVKRMQNDWSNEAFRQCFIHMLKAYDVLPQSVATTSESHQTNAPVQSSQRFRIVVAIQDKEKGPQVSDWEERALQAIKRSFLFDAFTITYHTVADLELALSATSGAYHGFIILAEDGEVSKALSSLLSQVHSRTGLKVLVACRHSPQSDVHHEAYKVVEWGPVIPFHTSLYLLQGGNPIIGLYGFESGNSNVSDVVHKIQHELSNADIKWHITSELSPEEKVALDQKISAIRSLLEPTPGIALEVVRTYLQDHTLMTVLGQQSVNIFSNASNKGHTIANILDLAMAIERPVCQTQAAPMPDYKHVLTNIEAHTFHELLECGVGLQAVAYNCFCEAKISLAVLNYLRFTAHEKGADLAGASNVIPLHAGLLGRGSLKSLSATGHNIRITNGIIAPQVEEGVQPLPPVATLTELLALEDASFIECAYRTFLKRSVDPSGRSHYMNLLKKNVSRYQIVADIRLSKEGVMHAVALPGMEQVIRKYTLLNKPLIKPFMHTLSRIAKRGS